MLKVLSTAGFKVQEANYLILIKEGCMAINQVSITVLTGHTFCILLKKNKFAILLSLGLVFAIFVGLCC